MRRLEITFSGGKLKLEGLGYFPDGAGPFPAVVLCHPHPLYGGSMDNDVILTVASVLADKGIIAFMFNFRGVGRSRGEFDNGNGEQDDARAAISWIEGQKETDRERIGLCGYSFGGMVALAEACRDNRVKGLALISPALQPNQYKDLREFSRPKLLVTGSDDHIIVAEQVEKVFAGTSGINQFHLVAGADHFWYGHLKTVSGKVAEFFSKLFVDN